MLTTPRSVAEATITVFITFLVGNLSIVTQEEIKNFFLGNLINLVSFKNAKNIPFTYNFTGGQDILHSGQLPPLWLRHWKQVTLRTK